jgi:hypothetical protein
LDLTHVDAVELDAVPEAPATEKDVVFLHGRGDAPEVAPGDLIHDQAWGERRLVAPTLDTSFYRQPFEAQIRHVDELVGDARLAIGFSFGSWLLLTVVAMRQLTDRPVPDLILLSPILGYGGTPAAGLVAPYARELRRHLGLSEWAHWLPNRTAVRPPIVNPERIAFIHGTQDPQCATEDVKALAKLGYPVSIVDDGHRLESPSARSLVRRTLSAVMGSSGLWS